VFDPDSCGEFDAESEHGWHEVGDGVCYGFVRGSDGAAYRRGVAGCKWGQFCGAAGLGFDFGGVLCLFHAGCEGQVGGLDDEGEVLSREGVSRSAVLAWDCIGAFGVGSF
jgi:hypothetical protein